MTLKGAETVGLKVISVKENKEIGTIKDIIYDPKKNKVIAFLVSVGDVLAEAKVIPFGEIKDITKEAFLVKSAQSIKPGSKAVKPFTASDDSDTYIKDTTIITEEGKELGKGKDIVFDTKTGQVQFFEVRLNNQTQQIKVADVITSSDTKTVVKEGEPQESGGIMEKAKQLIQ